MLYIEKLLFVFKFTKTHKLCGAGHWMF